MTRVAVYVDGFNLYFGLKATSGRRHLWLDLQALSRRLLRQGQTLEYVTYFTARVRDNGGSQQRQADYLDALASHTTLVTIADGRFQEKVRRCRNCGDSWTVFEEKETDVNIAVALVEQAVEDLFDTALLVSADSDLCPAIRAVKRLRPEKRVIAAFPPHRHSADIRAAVDGYFTIGIDKVRQSQLPTTVNTRAGIALRRPKYWT